jgi:chemotaxis protein CheZ
MMKSRVAPAGEDLEALFDSIAAKTTEKVAAPAPPAVKAPARAPSSPSAAKSAPAAEAEIEAVFDPVAAEREEVVAQAEAQDASSPAKAPPAPVPADGSPEERIFQRLGHLTRMLHDSLHELGYDKNLEKAANSLPDARDRLAYIASLTGQAAEKVLSAVEHGQSLQHRVDADATRLAERWEKLYAREIGVEEFKLLAGETRDFLGGMRQQTTAMQGHLHEIMMAQDFHDLTGQVIKKVVDVAQMLESSLLTLLVETRAVTDTHHDGFLSGPQVKPEGRTDVVTSQAQVDELLESLGF